MKLLNLYSETISITIDHSAKWVVRGRVHQIVTDMRLDDGWQLWWFIFKNIPNERKTRVGAVSLGHLGTYQGRWMEERKLNEGVLVPTTTAR